jgi:hypothetical protein
VDESPAQDALSEEQEQVLLLQSAINKTYRHKLLEFRRSVTPDMLNGMRATLPPELVPELDAILREAAALSDDEVAEFESALAASEASAASPAAVEAEVLATTAASEAAADGPLFEDDPSQQAGPYALSPEERVAWEIMQDPNIPEDFMRWGGAAVGGRPWGCAASSLARGLLCAPAASVRPLNPPLTPHKTHRQLPCKHAAGGHQRDRAAAASGPAAQRRGGRAAGARARRGRAPAVLWRASCEQSAAHLLQAACLQAACWREEDAALHLSRATATVDAPHSCAGALRGAQAV